MAREKNALARSDICSVVDFCPTRRTKVYWRICQKWNVNENTYSKVWFSGRLVQVAMVVKRDNITGVWSSEAFSPLGEKVYEKKKVKDPIKETDVLDLFMDKYIAKQQKLKI